MISKSIRWERFSSSFAEVGSVFLQWWQSRVLQTWQQKGGLILLAPLAVGLQTGLAADRLVYYFFWALITAGGWMTIGYLSHDLSDVNEDLIAGKTNLWTQYPREGHILLILSTVVAIGPWYFLPSNMYSYILLSAELVCLGLYALPPFRFKNHLFLSLILDATYAYAIPVVLAGYTFYLLSGDDADLVFLALCGGWSLVVGARHYINHICMDLINDKEAGRQTLATRYGVSRLRSCAAEILLVAELILLSSFLLHVFVAQSLWVSLFVLCLLTTAIYRYAHVSKYRLTEIPLDKVYKHELVLVLGVVCVLSTPSYLWIMVIYAFCFARLRWMHLVFQLLRGPASTIVNYGIYYFRKYIQLENEVGARRSEYPAYLQRQRKLKKVKEVGAIAVVNQHKKKYTETFIWEELEQLPFGVYYLHGGLLPQYVDDGRPLFRQQGWSNRAWSLWAELQGKKSDHYLEEAICRFLINKEIRAILVHFGPSALRLLPISRATGIPMLAYFHGYDIHHKAIQSSCTKGYISLVKEAAALLCASDDIRNRLRSLGAAEDRLHTLPAYVHLSLFPYTDHSQRPPHLLFVGRFCETKSPHLLMIAFAELLKILPEARLTLIGQDGGGELFEACRILARALKIEGHTHFMGACTHQEVALQMHRARALVLPSLTTPINGDREGTPVALMEACAAGLPVVASAHAGILEQIEDEENGLLIKEYDLEHLTQAMLRICTDDALNYRLGLAAARRIRSDQRISRHSEQLQQYILQVISSS